MTSIPIDVVHPIVGDVTLLRLARIAISAGLGMNDCLVATRPIQDTVSVISPAVTSIVMLPYHTYGMLIWYETVASEKERMRLSLCGEKGD